MKIFVLTAFFLAAVPTYAEGTIESAEIKPSIFNSLDKSDCGARDTVDKLVKAIQEQRQQVNKNIDLLREPKNSSDIEMIKLRNALLQKNDNDAILLFALKCLNTPRNKDTVGQQDPFAVIPPFNATTIEGAQIKPSIFFSLDKSDCGARPTLYKLGKALQEQRQQVSMNLDLLRDPKKSSDIEMIKLRNALLQKNDNDALTLIALKCFNAPSNAAPEQRNEQGASGSQHGG